MTAALRIPRPSAAQRRALKVYADGGGPGESFASDFSGGPTPLQWQRHERTIESLHRHGWVDKNGITDLGRRAIDGETIR